MQLVSVKAVARAVAHSVGVFSSAFGSYVRIKRCSKCRHLLVKRAIVCTHCGKWQG